MKDLFVTYIEHRFQDVPCYVYVLLVLFFVIGAISFVYHYGLKKSIRYSSRLLLVEYTCLMVSSTVLFRTYNERREHKFQPFWSYLAILEGKENFIPEIILNILVFVPIGLLLGCGFRRISWWQVLATGLLMSTTIEVLQFVFNKGYAEVDDLIHNTLGCMIGYGLYHIVMYIYESISRRQGRPSY